VDKQTPPPLGCGIVFICGQFTFVRIAWNPIQRPIRPNTFDGTPALPLHYLSYESQAPSKELTMPKPRRRRKIGSKKRHSKWKARHHIQ
jgi:hypothetical protein